MCHHWLAWDYHIHAAVWKHHRRRCVNIHSTQTNFPRSHQFSQKVQCEHIYHFDTTKKDIREGKLYIRSSRNGFVKKKELPQQQTLRFPHNVPGAVGRIFVIHSPLTRHHRVEHISFMEEQASTSLSVTLYCNRHCNSALYFLPGISSG